MPIHGCHVDEIPPINVFLDTPSSICKNEKFDNLDVVSCSCQYRGNNSLKSTTIANSNFLLTISLTKLMCLKMAEIWRGVSAHLDKTLSRTKESSCKRLTKIFHFRQLMRHIIFGPLSLIIRLTGSSLIVRALWKVLIGDS